MTLGRPNSADLLRQNPDSRGSISVLRDELLACASERDAEAAHDRADDALIKFIGDYEIGRLYDAIKKWYA